MVKYMLIIVPIFIGITFLFTIAMIISPKLRGKMMARQIKAAKYMLDEAEDDLRNMSTRGANISKEGLEISSRAIKDGFTKEKKYCKNCLEPIDEDSVFCKRCGKKQ